MPAPTPRCTFGQRESEVVLNIPAAFHYVFGHPFQRAVKDVKVATRATH